ncbi:ABC transporter permease [Butyricicoccus sp. Marseille-Q5471]|uniref:ABC transporter permease n=1 Tax=Butyricicoccus sp. Marseille-Q5471 TaxID=3039493 RepID=UPI0024BC9517|nr:ABC transporter permease subunit [Butyricicoccus sp. Marseille-Q5471]
MFKYLNPKRFYHAAGKKHFWEFLILAGFLLFFYGPLLNMIMMAFANKYEVPAVLPQEWGFKWWEFVFSQQSLVSSIVQSLLVAVITTACSMLLCIPAAYALARFKFPGRKVFMLSFLLTNAFPKLGIYTSIGILFYKYNLMGTLLGVVIIHMINSMMFMVWLPASAFRSVHRQQEEAARDVGAGPLRTFFKVSLPMAMPGIAVATLYTFLGSMEEAQGTMLVGLARIKTMPVEMYGIILDYPGQAGAVFAILLVIPAAVLIFAMRKYIGPEAIAGGFKMK